MGRRKWTPEGAYKGGGRCGCTIGAPSTELSLGGLLASRARLRFTRPKACTARSVGEQEQSAWCGSRGGVTVRRAGQGTAKVRLLLVWTRGFTAALGCWRREG